MGIWMAGQICSSEHLNSPIFDSTALILPADFSWVCVCIHTWVCVCIHTWCLELGWWSPIHVCSVNSITGTFKWHIWVNTLPHWIRYLQPTGCNALELSSVAFLSPLFEAWHPWLRDVTGVIVRYQAAWCICPAPRWFPLWMQWRRAVSDDNSIWPRWSGSVSCG